MSDRESQSVPDALTGQLLEKLQMPALLLNANGAASANAQWGQLVPEPCPGDTPGRIWSDAVQAADRDHAVDRIVRAVTERRPDQIECQLGQTHTDARWFLVSVLPTDANHNADCWWLCVATDIHHLKIRQLAAEVAESGLVTEQALLQSEERLSLATQVGGLGIWDYHLEGDVLHCDDTWYRIMGFAPDEPPMTMERFRTIIHPDDVERATEVTQTATALAASGRDYAITFRIIRPTGEVRYIRSAAAIQGQAGSPSRAVGFVIDITEAHLAQTALEELNRALQAERELLTRENLEDPLTGIANRRSLDRELMRLCNDAGGIRTSTCVALVDIDEFKTYNDRYGHINGDVALQRVSAALADSCREGDFVARFGGEEFGLIIADSLDPTSALDRVRSTISELKIMHEDSPTGFLTVSAGCLIISSTNLLTPSRILRLADAALYKAKSLGRNRYVITHPPPPGESPAE